MSPTKIIIHSFLRYVSSCYEDEFLKSPNFYTASWSPSPSFQVWVPREAALAIFNSSTYNLPISSKQSSPLPVHKSRRGSWRAWLQLKLKFLCILITIHSILLDDDDDDNDDNDNRSGYAWMKKIETYQGPLPLILFIALNLAAAWGSVCPPLKKLAPGIATGKLCSNT